MTQPENKEFEDSNENAEEIDEHVVHMWEPLKFSVDKDYDYLRKGKFQIGLYKVLYGFVRVVFTVICKIFLGLKTEGKENIKKVKDRGVVSIMNHVNVIDCVLEALAFPKRRLYSTTIEANFKIPVVRSIIKVLGAVPMSSDPNRLKEMMRAMEQALKNGDVVHMYPEGVLIPYCKELRKFKGGAFYLACATESPIIPIVLKQRKRTGLWKLKRKPCITMKILEPVESKGKTSKQLLNECRHIMEEELKTQDLEF